MCCKGSAAAVCAAAAVFILFLLRKRLTHIILPLIIGGILFYILDPLICYLEKKPRMRRGAAIIVVYLVVVTIFTALLVFAAPVIKSDIISLAEDVPAISDRLNSAVNIIFDAVFGKSGGENKIGGMLRTHAEDLLERTVNGIGAKIRKLGESAPKIYEKSADFILDSVTGIIFSYYFLKDKNKIGRWLLGFFPV